MTNKYLVRIASWWELGSWRCMNCNKVPECNPKKWQLIKIIKCRLKEARSND